jgi:hypothetical protein
LCECNLHHEKEQFHQKFSWRQDDVSLSGKEILWLWNGETWLISIYKASQSSNEEEFCLNVNMVATWDPRSLMWRICSGRSLTLKLQFYHLSLTHCTVIGFYCIAYHGDWNSHGTGWSKPWLFFHPPSTPLSSFQTSLCLWQCIQIHLINGVVLLYQKYVGEKDLVPKNKGKSHLQLGMIMNFCALVAESKQGWRWRAYW